MSADRQRKKAPPLPGLGAVPGAPMFAFGYDPSWKMEPVDIVSSKEAWTEYELADGTVIRVKAVVLDVKKVIGQYSPEGDPIYVTQSTLVQQVRAPDSLKKKA